MKTVNGIILTLTIAISATIPTILLYAFDFSSAQNATLSNNSTAYSNMTNTNATSSNAPAKMHLQAAIDALKGGDSQGASTHLNAAKQFIVQGEALKHLDEGIKALALSDSKTSIKHLELAAQTLG